MCCGRKNSTFYYMVIYFEFWDIRFTGVMYSSAQANLYSRTPRNLSHAQELAHATAMSRESLIQRRYEGGCTMWQPNCNTAWLGLHEFDFQSRMPRTPFAWSSTWRGSLLEQWRPSEIRSVLLRPGSPLYEALNIGEYGMFHVSAHKSTKAQ